MALMAVAAISSVGGAFAFSPAAKSNAVTYYAVRTAGGFHWTTVQPDPDVATCQTAPAGVCTISTSTAPVDNQVPAAHASDPKGLYQAI